ncbi:MAG: ferrous iron transport protein B [Deferrisomatales bacterium]
MESCKSNCGSCHLHIKEAQPGDRATRKIVIVGLPNTGKSQVFNNLTGEYTLVANYPWTTVEPHRKTVRIRDRCYEVVDTPGMHCLFVHSEEELEVRELLLTEKPDVVIQCVDANLLKQSLALTADLLELRVPLVISLNAVDETSRRGVWIDAKALSRLLGVPVVESVPVAGMGTASLVKAVEGARRGRWEVRYGDILEKGLERIAELFPPGAHHRRKLGQLLLLGDLHVREYLEREYGAEVCERMVQVAHDTRRVFRGSLAAAMSIKKNAWVDEIADAVVRTHRVVPNPTSQTVARICRHPVWGLPILLGVLYAAFLLVVNVANVLAEWMNELLWVPVEGVLLGVLPPGALRDFLIGDYGVISFGVANALLTVLPILSVFFLMYNAVEDTGYIPNVSVMTRRLLEKLGLSGAAIMPLVLAFGCKTMATMTTRTLASKKERYIAVYLIAFAIPCAAQIGLNMSILGRMGTWAFLVAFGVLGFVEILVGLILNKLLPDDRKTEYLQHLPSMRLPSPRAVLVKTYYRLAQFLKEALPVFVLAAAALYVVDALGILDAAKGFLAPLVQGFLGLPLDMVDALILCIARHEAAAALIIGLIDKGMLNPVQCIVAVTLTTMFVPCFANIMAMIKELGYKTAVPMIVYINGSAFVIAGILNWTLLALMTAT